MHPYALFFAICICFLIWSANFRGWAILLMTDWQTKCFVFVSILNFAEISDFIMLRSREFDTHALNEEMNCYMNKS